MVRGSNKAYDDNDQLKNEYSISLFGVKYPLVTVKGSFTCKNSKKGKQRRNKLLNASRKDKQAYVTKVKSLFNIFDEDKQVGDAKEELHPVQVQVSNNKIYHKHASKGNVPSNQIPDSLHNLVNLTTLNISGNQLDSLPSNWCDELLQISCQHLDPKC